MQTGEGRSLIQIKQAIVVEGKYDKNKIMQIYDAIVVETDGFGIFKDEDKKNYLKMLADSCGVLVLTDSDSAGFVIRNYVKSICQNGEVKHAYIPDVYGKEKRKTKPGSEGKIGVEGVPNNVIIKAIADAVGQENTALGSKNNMTMADLYDMGLIGTPDSKQKRGALQKSLGLPEKLSAKALLSVINRLCLEEEIRSIGGEK